MQGLSAKTPERLAGSRGEVSSLRAEARAVDVVPHDWVSDRSQMHANLMSATGFQSTFDQARDLVSVGPTEGLDDLPVGQRFAPAFAHRHLVTRVRVPVDRLVDDALGPVGHPPSEGEVAALQGA